MKLKTKDFLVMKEENVKKVLKFGEIFLYFIGGFLLSRSNVLSECKPFGISIICVSRKKNFIYSGLGCALSYILFCDFPTAIRYITSVIIACLGAFAIDTFEEKSEPFLPMATAALSTLATGLILEIRLSSGAESYILRFAESILAGAVAFFFYKALECTKKKLRLHAMPMTNIVCLVISVGILLMSVSDICIFGISPIKIFASFLILCTVYCTSSYRGICAALGLGFAMGITGESKLYLVGAYGFSAMICALFSQFGILAITAAYVITSAFFAAANSFSGQAGTAFVEAVCGAVIFVLLPNRVYSKICEILEGEQYEATDSSLRQSLVVKLRFASNALLNVSENVSLVSEKIRSVSKRDSKRRQAELSKEEYICRELIDEKTNQIRLVAADQFVSLSGMLFDLADEFNSAETIDGITGAKLRRMLGSYEIYPQNICVITDKFKRCRVEIHLDSSYPNLSDGRIRLEAERICGVEFEKGVITNLGNGTMLCFSEKPNYRISTAFSQHSAEGALCGDTVKIINDGKGRIITILSDGMGKGSRAALDGAMASGLLSKLLYAGFGFDCALKVVNSALLVKSNEESLATLDIAAIDLFTGRTEFYKAGAAASYIIKEKGITKVELTSMAAGILRGVEFAKRTAVLSVGDKVIMLSDGICDLGEEWLNSILRFCDHNSPKEIADYILNNALRCTDPKHCDDMSVIVSILDKNTNK